MRSRLLLCPIVALLCGGAVAGCGSTTVHHVTTTVTRSTSGGAPTTSSSATSSSTTSSAASSADGTSALAGRSPHAILALAAGALRRSGGYAMRADLVQDHKRTVIDLSATGADRYQASLTTGATMFELVALPGSAYLRGNQTFWRAQLSGGGAALARTRARELAGRWLDVPASGTRSVTRTLGTLTPGTLARCLTEDHGSLTVSGPTTVDGTRALVVRDAGNAPGSTPSTIAVAADGAPYPLRYEATGATRRGGRVDVCNDGKGDGATGSITLSQFGRTPGVQAPAGASGGAPV